MARTRDSRKGLQLARSRLLAATLVAFSTHTASGQLVIEVLDEHTPLVRTDPAYPVQGKTSHVVATLRNTGSQALSDVRATAQATHKDAKRTIGELSVNVPAGATATLRIPWQPTDNGWHDLRLTASAPDGSQAATAEARVPVLARQFYFQWYTRNWPEDRKLRWVNLVQVLDHDTQTYDYWRDRGVFAYAGAGWRRAKSGERFAEYLFEQAEPYGGVVYDELGAYSDRVLAEKPELVGFELFTERHPEMFTGLYVSGALKPSMANLVRRAPFDHFDEQPPGKKGVDLLLIEVYHNYLITSFNSRRPYAYLDHAIYTARVYDALENALIVVCFAGTEDPEIEKRGRGPYTVTKADLEDQVRYIRRHAPSMPGVAFYGYPSSKELIDWEEITLFADSLFLKYFIKPVMTIWDDGIQLSTATPTVGEAVDLTATVHNIGAMDASNVTVEFFDGHPDRGGERIGQPIELPVVPADRHVPPGRVVVEQEWTPKAGHRSLFVRLSAGDGVTLLDSLARRDVSVDQK